MKYIELIIIILIIIVILHSLFLYIIIIQNSSIIITIPNIETICGEGTEERSDGKCYPKMYV